MNELTGIPKVLFTEVMDEIQEEIHQSFEKLIVKDTLDKIILDIQNSSKEIVIQTIKDNYDENMSPARKMILGEKLSRNVISIAKERIHELVTTILHCGFNVIDELRNEIIGEVFEETD